MYKYAQKIKTSCNGNLNNRIVLDKPRLASSFWYIFKFAGKIATSNAIIPHEANCDKIGIQRQIPKTISKKPLVEFNNLRFEKYDGMIFIYNSGLLK